MPRLDGYRALLPFSLKEKGAGDEGSIDFADTP